MRKLLGITAAGMLLALTGCGGADDVADDENTTSDSTQSTTESTDSTPTDSTESSDSSASGDYCDELKQAKAEFSNFTAGQLDEDTYNQLVDRFNRIADVAPDDVKGEWENAVDGITRLHDLLAQANINFDDYQDMLAGQAPPGADAQKLQELLPELQKAADSMNSVSSAKIQQSVQDCGLTLN